MYRVAVEAMLGISLRGGALHVDPCIPRAWPGYEVTFAPAGAHYRIEVVNPDGVSRGVARVELDGAVVNGDVPIVRDGRPHVVKVTLGLTAPASPSQ
jgi:cyclic beta-1,2-glucan synthetase